MRRIVLLAALTAATPAWAQTFPAERDWVPFRCGNAPMSDGQADQSGAVAERDLVGSAQAPAGFHAADGQFLYLRLRVDDDPTQGQNLRPFAWGFAISSDGRPNTYEGLITVDGAAGSVALYRNRMGAADAADDPADTPPAATYPFATHGRAVAADTSVGGTRDHFIDMAAAWSHLSTINVGPSTNIAVWAGSSTMPDRLNLDFACHDAGGSGRIPRLSEAAAAPERAGGTGTGGMGGAGGIRLEGGPGCSYVPRGNTGLGLLLLAPLFWLRRRRRGRPDRTGLGRSSALRADAA